MLQTPNRKNERRDERVSKMLNTAPGICQNFFDAVYVIVVRLPPLLVVKGQTRIWGSTGEDEKQSRGFLD